MNHRAIQYTKARRALLAWLILSLGACGEQPEPQEYGSAPLPEPKESGSVPLPERFTNPVISGFAPDPSIVRVGEDFYLVNSSFEYFPGIPIYHSSNLAEWELIGYALHRESQVDLDTISSSGGIHASTIRYHDGTYYVITTNVKDGKPINFVVTATDPRGPWSKAHIIEDAPGIDPSLFFDDDGRVWYVGNHQPDDPAFPGESEIWLQELDIVTYQLVGERHFLWRGCCQGVWAEGPHIYKKDGYYYLLISEGGTAYEHALSVAISDSITGPYLNNPRNPILTHRHLSYDTPITGVGHADFVELADGRWYAVLLGWRLVDGVHGILGRETFLVPMTWETEPYWWKEPKYTFPVVSPDTGRVELSFPSPFGGYIHRRLRRFTDQFDDELSLEWNMRRTHDEPFYSLTDNPDHLRLKLLPGEIRERERYAFLGIRQRDFGFIAETWMTFEANSPNEEAGITVMQNDRSAIVMSLRDGMIRLYHTNDGKRTEIASTPWDKPTVSFRVKGRWLDLRFEYSEDGRDRVTLADNVDATVLSPAVIEGFNYTGIYVGVYATSNGMPSEAFADFSAFSYSSAMPHTNWYHRQLENSE